jgi:hypothetical protein
MKIGILSCIWKRNELNLIFLNYYQKLCQKITKNTGVEFVRLVVESEQILTEYIKVAGWKSIFHENQPLGRKWNAGLKALKKENVNAVLILGSDDFINDKLLLLYIETLHKKEKKYLGLKDLFFYDQPSRKMLFWPGYEQLGYANHRIYESIGLGRCIHKDILDACQWTLWEDQLNNTLDSSMQATLNHCFGSDNLSQMSKTFSCIEHQVIALDVKTNENIWTFRKFSRFNDQELARNPVYIDQAMDILSMIFDEQEIDKLDRLASNGDYMMPAYFREVDELKSYIISRFHDEKEEFILELINRYLKFHPNDLEMISLKGDIYFPIEREKAEIAYQEVLSKGLVSDNYYVIKALKALFDIHLKKHQIENVTMIYDKLISLKDTITQADFDFIVADMNNKIEIEMALLESIHVGTLQDLNTRFKAFK